MQQATPTRATPQSAAPSTRRPRVLFFVEGFTDIRFVVGLNEIAELTLCVPQNAFHVSGLRERIAAAGIAPTIEEIPGGRAAFQFRSAAWLWRHARRFDVVLSQEMLRGSLNATIIGSLKRVPVVTTLMIAPVEYFRCRRERRQIGGAATWVGVSSIRLMLTINGRLSTRCVALGDYLCDIARQYCGRVEPGGYYGVDTRYFAPASSSERLALREKLGLPGRAFLIFLASRISHEKDPETVLRAVATLRQRGVNAVLMNLSGGYREFLSLASTLDGTDATSWVIARPAAHPMTELADYFRAADCTVQASLAEGLGLSPLESLSCGVPVVATDVGGMGRTLRNVASLVPARDHEAMARALEWVASHQEAAREQARRGAALVHAHWSREQVFRDLRRVFDDVVGSAHRPLDAAV